MCGGPSPLLGAARRRSLWARGGARRSVAPVWHRAREVAARAVPAALALGVGACVVGCAGATATAGAPAAAGRPAATRTAAPVYGPPAPDPACLAAQKAEQTLQSRQGQDQNNESALDQDFMNFAAALSAAAQSEKRPAAAQAMTALASDYTDLVESQSGAAQLPAMSQVQKDGAAFDKACSP
jgi:hypothetical protein